MTLVVKGEQQAELMKRMGISNLTKIYATAELVPIENEAEGLELGISAVGATDTPAALAVSATL